MYHLDVTLHVLAICLDYRKKESWCKNCSKKAKCERLPAEQTTPGFWMHDWRSILSSLCVDDFGVKYVGKEHAEH